VVVLALHPLQWAAGRCLPGCPYSWRQPICIICLSCDHAETAAASRAPWEGRVLWGEDLSEKERGK